MDKFIFSGLLFFFISCSSSSVEESKTSGSKAASGDIKQMEWVLGKWECLTRRGSLFEIWTKTNDTVFSGRSFIVGPNDTVFTESISLEFTGNHLYYIPAVSGQNDAQPVRFKFVSAENAEVVFENREHDFPQRIIYKNPHPDTLYARVEGDIKGTFRKEEFFMARR